MSLIDVGMRLDAHHLRGPPEAEDAVYGLHKSSYAPKQRDLLWGNMIAPNYKAGQSMKVSIHLHMHL